MATRRQSRKAGRGTTRQGKGSTSTASQGLVLTVIKGDPQCRWMGEFIQQAGEKFYGVEHKTDLTPAQRVGWIRFNSAMAAIGRSLARGKADFNSLLGLLERIGSDEGSADLAGVEAEVKAEVAALMKDGSADGEAAAGSDALLDEVIRDRKEERVRLNAVHAEEMHDWRARRKVQMAWDCIVLGATISCLVLVTLIILGVIGDEARMIGGTAVTAGIAVIGVLQVILWGRWNPPPPGQFR
jgi:hypothetical protein